MLEAIDVGGQRPDAGELALELDPQRAAFRHEPDLLDQRADQSKASVRVSGACSAGMGLITLRSAEEVRPAQFADL
jgi:hypothetical protein